MTSQRAPIIALFALSIAVAFFTGVGATLWFKRGDSATAVAQPTTPPPGQNTDPKAGLPAAPADAGAQPSAAVFINDVQVTAEQLDELQRIYSRQPPPGRYWYDEKSGLYGAWGYETAGYIYPGHRFGELPAHASNGNTGVFINGREINMTEAQFFQRIFGAVYQGRWWLDSNGNVGVEGNPMPAANLVAALQQAQPGSGGGGGDGYRWRDEINRSSGGAENGCVWVSMPGTTYSSAGC
jgi:hypothetical protein